MVKVLIVSTSLGAGHDGVADVLTKQLAVAGHQSQAVDLLHLLPLGIGGLIKRYYAAQLRYAPWTYEQSYKSLSTVHDPMAAALGRLGAKRVADAVAALGADVIVSNNPHASLALGYLRRTRRLQVPVVTYVTDFGVHELWVHPGVDATFVVHESCRVEANEHGAKNVTVARPLVDESFAAVADGGALRRSWGLPAGSRAVLVTAGSWGVGQLMETVRELSAIDGVVPVVVCGRDDALRRQLAARTAARVFGWVDDMPTLMANVDALVENAGGLTSMEALATGVPVISYRPIAGHGRHNASAMERAGVIRYARNADQLREALSGFDEQAGQVRLDGADIVPALELLVRSQ